MKTNENYDNLKKGNLTEDLINQLTPEILEEALKLTKNKILTKHKKSTEEALEEERALYQPIINGVDFILKSELEEGAINYGLKKNQLIDNLNQYDNIIKLILKEKWNITEKNIKDYYINHGKMKNLMAYIGEASGNYIRPLQPKQNYYGFLEPELLQKVNIILLERKVERLNKNGDTYNKLNYEKYLMELEKLETRYNIKQNPYYKK